MEKILKDRLNTLKSELSDIVKPKLGKYNMDMQRLLMEERIKEVEWLLKKVKL